MTGFTLDMCISNQVDRKGSMSVLLCIHWRMCTYCIHSNHIPFLVLVVGEIHAQIR
jgi:hypothetical protein